MHGNLAGQLLWMGAAMMSAAVFGAAAKKAGQPKVLGALLAGLIIGIAFTWTHLLHDMRNGHTELISGLAEVAASMLLLMAGLESNLKSIIQDARTGWKVALIGIAAPMLGGFGYVFMTSDVSWPVALFQGGVFAATSVGITAAVLGELGVLKKKYSRIIISAAVIDDVLGLVVLTICQALNTSGVDTMGIVFKISGAMAFVVIIPVLGHVFGGKILRALNRIDPQARPAIVIGWMLIYGAGAMYAGLAAIVGAYFAGVALEEIYFTKEDQSNARPHKHDVEKMIEQFIAAFGPIFFVYAGCVVDPAVFLKTTVLFNGLAFTVIATLGKLLSGLAAPKDSRLLVGIGMSPRGEVGIIFAAIGLQTKILSAELFGASMIMVLLTTVVTPPLLGKLIKKQV